MLVCLTCTRDSVLCHWLLVTHSAYPEIRDLCRRFCWSACPTDSPVSQKHSCVTVLLSLPQTRRREERALVSPAPNTADEWLGSVCARAATLASCPQTDNQSIAPPSGIVSNYTIEIFIPKSNQVGTWTQMGCGGDEWWIGRGGVAVCQTANQNVQI